MKHPKVSKVVVMQTCVPDYRLAFFDLMKAQFESMLVYSGATYYQESVRGAAGQKPWHKDVRNTFLMGRRLLWQHFPLSFFLTPDPIVLELNPRNISVWLLSIFRALSRSPVVLWGHAWARSGQDSRTVMIRLLMWRLANARIVYTCRQVNELKKVLPGVILPARNALYSQDLVKRRAVKSGNHFVYVGRMVAEKKPMLLLRAFADLAKNNPNVMLDFVGAGPELSRIEELSVEMGIRDRVIIHGHVSDPETLGRIYAGAIAAVSPGYVGLSATQAFFFGVPMLIAENEPHAPEVEACSRLNSVFFPSDSENELTKALASAWDNRLHWAKVSASIQDDVCARYSIEKMVEGFGWAIEASIGDVGASVV